MSTLIVSDIHADIEAFDAILTIAGDARFVRKYSKVERIFNLGDTIERGYHPRDIIDRMRDVSKRTPIISLMGNHDDALLSGRPVSGSDRQSREAHAQLDNYIDFLKDLPQFYVDAEAKILAVHGGPLDPRELDGNWLYERSWQRISSKSFISSSGYHYTPKEAFNFVKRTYGKGYLILCGHEHEEAAFSDRNGDILKSFNNERTTYARHDVAIRWLVREPKTSYLIRIGISGPEGYHTSLGLNVSHFGLVWKPDHMERVGLFRFKLHSL